MENLDIVFVLAFSDKYGVGALIAAFCWAFRRRLAGLLEFPSFLRGLTLRTQRVH